MSRRGRAALYLLCAAVAAAAGATIANSYGSSVTRGYGPLRPAVVAAAGLGAGAPLGPDDLARLKVRLVPERFLPPGALATAAQAGGLEPVAAIPAGSYVLGAQLRTPRRRGPARASVAAGRGPVEVGVSGAEALLLAGARPEGARVDVVVTAEPTGAGEGRTYIAAKGVPLLGLRPEIEGTPGGISAATLALTRRQALKLIAAESFARKVTLISAGGSG